VRCVARPQYPIPNRTFEHGAVTDDASTRCYMTEKVNGVRPPRAPLTHGSVDRRKPVRETPYASVRVFRVPEHAGLFKVRRACRLKVNVSNYVVSHGLVLRGYGVAKQDKTDSDYHYGKPANELILVWHVSVPFPISCELILCIGVE
jgi:hypothetical protein